MRSVIFPSFPLSTLTADQPYMSLLNLYSAAESGWDFSSRWLATPKTSPHCIQQATIYSFTLTFSYQQLSLDGSLQQLSLDGSLLLLLLDTSLLCTAVGWWVYYKGIMLFWFVQIEIIPFNFREPWIIINTFYAS